MSHLNRAIIIEGDYGWATLFLADDEIHVVPIKDSALHWSECWCDPDISYELVGDDGFMVRVTHNANDKRELKEGSK